MYFKPEEVIEFWFTPDNRKKWFSRTDAFDTIIRDKFLSYHAAIVEGQLEHWKDSPEGTLAYIIVLDQFSRNMFRGDAKTHASDGLAVIASKEAISKGFDKMIDESKRLMIYMPLMHSESLDDQMTSVQLFNSDPTFSSFAISHMKTIESFGRFPSRNTILGRESTPEELEYLKPK